MRTCKIIFLNTEYLNTSSKRVGGNLFTHATSEAVSTKSIHRERVLADLQTTFRAPKSAAPRTCAKNLFHWNKVACEISVAVCCNLLQSVAFCRKGKKRCSTFVNENDNENENDNDNENENENENENCHPEGSLTLNPKL